MKKAKELHLLETPKRLWQEISIDIIGPLFKLNDKDVIVVIVNWFIKMIRFKVITTTVLSEDIANRGLQFASKFIEDLIKVFVTIQWPLGLIKEKNLVLGIT